VDFRKDREMNSKKIHNLIDCLVQSHNDLSHYRRFECCLSFVGAKACKFNEKRADKREASLELDAAIIKCEIKKYVLDDGVITGKMNDFAETFHIDLTD
jgi:hypothetical protein